MKYTKEHQWIEIQGEKALVGITAYAANQLGDLTWVSLPSVGQKGKANDVLCHLEAVKAEADAYFPVGGEILEVNSQLEAHPEIINEDPEGKGWIVKIIVSNNADLEHLYDEDGYRQYVSGLNP